MSRRKIFEKQIVDFATGEVFSETTHYRENNDETFGMHRTTEGIDWIFQFTGIELQMLVVLLELENLKSGIINLTPLVKEHLYNKFGKTARYIREVIASLEKKKALVKITTQDIILNPSYFYKGGTKHFLTKYEAFLKYLDNKNEKSN